MNYKIYFKMHLIFFYILTIFTNFIVSEKLASETINCLKNNDNDFCRMSFDEPYRYIANLDDSVINVPGCKAQKIWLFIRSGTTFPETKTLKRINQLSMLRDEILMKCEDKKKCSLNDTALEALKNWKSDKIREYQANTLTEEGKNELIGIAKRYQSRFPELMPNEYSNNTYRFKATNSRRTRESGQAFAIGLFGEENSKQVQFPKSDYIDLGLQPYEACDKWSEQVMKKSSTFYEYAQFRKSEIVKSMLENLSAQLQVDINFNQVISMYLICAKETARNVGTTSPWCSLLSSKDVEIMEFAADLISFYTSGKAYEVTTKLACPTLVDSFDFMRSENTVKASVYFSHTEAISTMLTMLGLERDENPLLHDSFESAKNRTWRMSLIDGSASNIAFVFFKCEYGEPEILFMHQERVVTLPECSGRSPCPLDMMEQLFPNDDDKCKFDELCSL